MELLQAVDEFEKQFKRVRSLGKGEDKDCLVTWSGGTARWGDIAPGVFSAEDRAVKAWLDTARMVTSNSQTVLEWIKKPEIVYYQMTMADLRQMHRHVSNRYAVRSQFRTYEK